MRGCVRKFVAKLISRHGLLLGLILVLGADALAEYVPVTQKHPLEAVLPSDLRALMMENPEVVFQVMVSPEGGIQDFLAVEGTHWRLLEPAIAKLKEAVKFEAAMLDGKPVPGKITVTISFFDPEQRAWRQSGSYTPMGGSVSDAVRRRTYDLERESEQYRESSPPDLDSPLRLVEARLKLVHPPDQPVPTGTVLVEYYVDHEGHPRLPRILKSDSESLSLSVLLSLENTRFEPPLRAGRPTYVKVRQPFNFD